MIDSGILFLVSLFSLIGVITLYGFFLINYFGLLNYLRKKNSSKFYRITGLDRFSIKTFSGLVRYAFNDADKNDNQIWTYKTKIRFFLKSFLVALTVFIISFIVLMMNP